MTSAYSGPELAAEIDFLDSARSAPEAQSRKAAIPQLLDVQPNDVVLEIGPGTGEDLQTIVASAPGVFGVGVELNPGLASEINRRSQDNKSLSVVVGDVRHLPIRGCSVNGVHVERVLQHVPDIECAVVELLRVCRSGARVAILEPDQELRAVDHSDGVTEALLRRRAASRYVNPTIGRRLFALLLDSGFIDVAIAGLATSYPASRLEAQQVVAEAVDDGELAEPTAVAYLHEIQDRQSRGTTFSVWVAFQAQATAP